LPSPGIINDPGTFKELLGDPDGTHVALEATLRVGVTGRAARGSRLRRAPRAPLRTHAIAAAPVKTEAVDAKTLVHLLRTGLLP
jgi:hypothetical protein